MTNLIKNIRYIHLEEADFQTEETQDEGVWYMNDGLFIKLRAKSLMLNNLMITNTFGTKYSPYSRTNCNGFNIFRFGEQYEGDFYPLKIREYLVNIEEYIEEKKIEKVII